MNMPSEYNRQFIDDNCNTAYLFILDNSFLFIHKCNCKVECLYIIKIINNNCTNYVNVYI